jgi:hypothetical protein
MDDFYEATLVVSRSKIGPFDSGLTNFSRHVKKLTIPRKTWHGGCSVEVQYVQKTFSSCL